MADANELRRLADALERCFTMVLPNMVIDLRDAAAILRSLAVQPLEVGQPTRAARDVLAERKRQIEREGWTPEHDDQHNNGELADAAACYANQIYTRWVNPPTSWPWDKPDWKPADRRSNLVKAGALILAEIERLDRAAAMKEPT